VHRILDFCLCVLQIVMYRELASIMIILIVGAYSYVRSSYLPRFLASVNSVIELLIQL